MKLKNFIVSIAATAIAATAVSTQAETVAELNAEIKVLRSAVSAQRSAEYAVIVDAVIQDDYPDLAALGIKAIAGGLDSLYVRLYFPISAAPESTLVQYKAKMSLTLLKQRIAEEGKTVSTATLYIHKNRILKLLPKL